MNENDVVKLMKSSNSEQEWNANCQKVKAAFNGYPDFWHASILIVVFMPKQLIILDKKSWNILINH
jgi:hypothetical protein